MFYGAIKVTEREWNVRLYQPKAKSVKLNIFSKNDQNNWINSIDGVKDGTDWVWHLNFDANGNFYQYEITQEDGTVTTALDPFAKSMAAFDWEGKNENVGKAAFVDVPDTTITTLEKINEPQPIIYEAHIRDLTSLRTDVTKPGSFNALKESKIAEHLVEMGISHIQFLPIHSCYALNEKNTNILLNGAGTGWSTNYNWGYDPHNYFSINGWFSSDPEDPYSRINEFREVVEYFHSHGIKVILDVVYNHIFDNKIFSDVIPGVYNREDLGDEQSKPVGQPAINSENPIAKQMIIESLEWFVKKFDVDGFRFDLLEFTDLNTIETFTKRLRAIKPNIVLHGEAWNWTDLDPKNSLVKGVTDNEYDFAYFNDTIRNAIKGKDDGDDFSLGLVEGNSIEYKKYVASTFGNLKDFDAPEWASVDPYHRYTNYPNNNLNYAACHDGHTLWDKINLTIPGDERVKFEYYRQAILMQQFTQGRKLFLQGTEILYTKPNDESGQDGDRTHTSKHIFDIFNLGSNYNENSYRTTDFTNGIRWDHIFKDSVKNDITRFFSLVNNYLSSTKFFNLSTKEEIEEAYTYNFTSKEKLIIDFSIAVDDEIVRVIHNFSESEYTYESDGEIIIDSKLIKHNVLGVSRPHSTILIRVK